MDIEYEIQDMVSQLGGLAELGLAQDDADTAPAKEAEKVPALP